MRAVIFANGQFSDPAGCRRLVQGGDLIVAVDGGTAHALAAGLAPHVVIGDLDSLEPARRAELQAMQVAVVSHPAAKDETDLELALLYAARQGVKEILVLAALGGRLDHMVANLSLLAHPALSGVVVRIVDGRQLAFLVRDRCCISGQRGDTVSLLPWGGDALGVSTQGLRWPLDREPLFFGLARGVSNVLVEEEAWVQVQEGMLLCVVTHGGE
ncbi:MAG: thiamine diphosphokinase [Anaerolineae bacterium]|nr:thiamine diphosphokinase [Anaerolineae bacterium]